MAEQSQTERKKVHRHAALDHRHVRGGEEPGTDEAAAGLAAATPTDQLAGIGGMLAKKMAGGNKPVQQRTKVMTTTTDMLSIETAASAEDVAIPAGFKEKK